MSNEPFNLWRATWYIRSWLLLLLDKGRNTSIPSIYSRLHTAFWSVPLTVQGRPDIATMSAFAALTKRLQPPLPRQIPTPRSRWRSCLRRRDWTDSGTRSNSTRPRGCSGCLGATLRSTDPSTTSGINLIQNRCDDFYFQSTSIYHILYTRKNRTHSITGVNQPDY